ncbi:MAG: hypothetical protein GJ676_20400 [Rhodobacteraceae bacterium]|nr:hypothetical protein [Paracoccaceae bacterium]
MTEEIRLMARLRDLPTLDQKLDLFAAYLRDEHCYDGFTYGIGLDVSSSEAALRTLFLKERGLPAEWMEIYINEQFGQNDPVALHAFTRQDVLPVSRLFQVADEGRIGPRFRTVLNRYRDFIQSGFVVPLRAGSIVGGMGLHSSTLTPDQHDAHFAQSGWLVEEMCRQFHDMVHWAPEIIAHTGLSDKNLAVLELAASGLQVDQIRHELGYRTVSSVTSHLERSRERLAARSNREMISRAIALGIVGPGTDRNGLLISDKLTGLKSA